jgi:NitT/TauT family transport system permease protein
MVLQSSSLRQNGITIRMEWWPTKICKFVFQPTLVSFAGVVVVWQLCVWFTGWSEQVFPGPMRVMRALVELTASGALVKHAVASLFRVTAGFYLAVFLGIPMGIAIGRLEAVRGLFNPLIQFLRPISPLAWIPLAMLWFGIGDQPAVFLIFLSSFFPIALSTAVAVSSINPIFFQVAANFNFSSCERITKIIVPAIIPDIIMALRLSASIAWIVVVAAEMIAVQSGLGYLILDSRNALRMDYVMAAMIVIGLIGLCLDFVMRRLSGLESATWGRISR